MTMKNAWLILLAVVFVVGVTGCAHQGMYGGCMQGSCMQAPETCAPCGAGGCGSSPCVIGGAPLTGMPYPYYTTRGPRDFLVADPKPIGP